MHKHLTDQAAEENARLLMNAVDEVLADRATFHRDDSPLPTYGTAPPVAQPGRPPMSQRATDASVTMLAAGGSSLMVGGAASLVMVASGYADPTVCAILLGAPTVLALAIARLVRTAKTTSSGDTHHHYNGTVQQTTQHITTQSRWLGKTTNNL